MSLTPNTKVVLPLSALLVGVFALFNYMQNDKPVSSSKELISSPSIQNIQNNNFSELTTTSTQNQAPANSLKFNNTQLNQENKKLKGDISQLLATNAELKDKISQQNQEIIRLRKIIDINVETHASIARLEKQNSEYFSQVQISGGSNAFAPTAEQKSDYRNAIAQNIELIKGYQTQLKTASN